MDVFGFVGLGRALVACSVMVGALDFDGHLTAVAAVRVLGQRLADELPRRHVGHLVGLALVRVPRMAWFALIPLALIPVALVTFPAGVLGALSGPVGAAGIIGVVGRRARAMALALVC